MTVRLREALREATDDLPGYPVYGRALATARRTRRRAAAATAAVFMVMAAMVWAVPLQPIGGGPGGAAPAAGAGALPDQIWVPIGALRVTDPFPVGAAAVLFSAPTSDDDETTVGVVAADSDRYRVLPHIDASAGKEVLLSPDGTRVDSAGWGQIKMDNLADGSVQKFRSAADGSEWSQPLGWSRDGHRLVVIDAIPYGSTYRYELNLMELDTGKAVRLVEVDGDSSIIGGYAVAFAPDGHKLALQFDDTVMITDLAGAPGPTFTLSPDEVLAGKGAWTPDGRGLTVAKRQDDTWNLITIDPANGEAIGHLDIPAVSGVTAIRLLGWEPGGAALVVAYEPHPASPTDFAAPLAIDQRIHPGNIRAVRLLSLAPGATTPAVRMTAPYEVRAVDVADELIATGRTRVADPPLIRLGPRGWFWLIVGVALAAAFFGRIWYATR